MDVMRSGEGVIWIDLLYGGQLTIVRLGLSDWPNDGEQEIGERAFVLRYWDVDDQAWE